LVAAGKWKSWHRKLALLLEIDRKIWGENGGDTAAGEGENVEGENVGEKDIWRCAFWLTRNLEENDLPRWKGTDVRRTRVSRLAFLQFIRHWTGLLRFVTSVIWVFFFLLGN